MVKRSNALDYVIVYQSYDYNGIKVDVGNVEEVLIKPVGASAWLRYDRDNLINMVKNMPSSESIQGIPRDVMLDYLGYDFEKQFWG